MKIIIIFSHFLTRLKNLLAESLCRHYNWTGSEVICDMVC